MENYNFKLILMSFGGAYGIRKFEQLPLHEQSCKRLFFKISRYGILGGVCGYLINKSQEFC